MTEQNRITEEELIELNSLKSILNKYHIDVVVHIMVGLPNETFEDLKNTVDFLCKHNFQGLKSRR